MNYKHKLMILGALVSFVLLILLMVKKTFIPSLPTHLSRNIYIGFWTSGFWDDRTQSINPIKLHTIENEIGKKVAIANYYQGWQYLSDKRIINDLNIITNNGWKPMISANPYFFDECPAYGKTLYQAIASGNCDVFLHKIGKTLSKVKKPFFLRFAWEMNVNSMEWSTLSTYDNPEDFILAWRRFHDIVQKEGARNVLWVFSPQIESPATVSIAKLYPGDKYVDWDALDGYNWGTAKSWSKWQNFYTIFRDSYLNIVKISPKKPLMIAETNTTDVGGSQANWYKTMLSVQIPDNFPKINAIIFFNQDKTSTEGVKWLIDNTTGSLKQFKASINNPIYKSNFNASVKQASNKNI